jgi:hypothetical protein
MRRLAIAGVLLLLAGCQNVVGPFQARAPVRVDDPNVTLYEQQRRSRERLALPDDSELVGPRGPASRPGESPLNK